MVIETILGTRMVPVVVGWLLWCVVSVGRLLVGTPPVAHTGAQLLLPGRDALWVQADVAREFGVNGAIILQKLHEWCAFNESEGRNQREGFSWSYNSYDEWQAKHFSWVSSQTVRRTLNKLEEAGVVISGQFASWRGDQRKWYRVNYAAVESKCTDVVDKMNGSSVQVDTAPVQNEQMGVQNGQIINNKEPQSKTAIFETQSVNIKQGRVDDDETQSPEEWEQILEPEGLENLHQQETLPPRDDATRATPPDSASPPPALAVKISQELRGCTVKHAQRLIERYGEGRVGTVYGYVRDNLGAFSNPTGFLTAELAQDNLGLGDAGASALDNFAKYADIINS